MEEDYYGSSAKYYDKLIEPMIKGLRGLGVGMFTPSRGMSILDVGCGTGELLKLYKDYPCHLFGIDASPAMLAAARRKLGKKVNLHLGDASSMPFGGEFFDLITAMFVLHEIYPGIRNSILKEMKRTLKKQGRILLIDYHTGPFRTVKGGAIKLLINVIEGFAGKRHFNNYRQFLSSGGLKALAYAHTLSVEKEKIVSGGNLVLYLLKKGGR